MKRITETESAHLKLLLYGRPGSTKTRTAATAALDPRTAPVLHLDMGGNPLSIRDFEYKPDIVRLDKFSDLDAAYDFLTWMHANNRGKVAIPKLVAELGLRTDYKTVIIDGVSELQRDAFMDETGNRGKGPGARLVARQIQHYGAVMAQLSYMAYLFYKLPMHVIITALEKEDTTSSGGVFYRPMLDGQAAGMVASYAYSVIRMVPISRLTKKQIDTLKDAGHVITKQDYGIAMLRPSNDYDAKDQSGIGSAYVIGPTMTRFLDAIERNTVDAKPYVFADDDTETLNTLTGSSLDITEPETGNRLDQQPEKSAG